MLRSFLGSARWLGVLSLLFLSYQVRADVVVFSQGFESNTNGWFAGGSFGSVMRVPSGTNGVTSAGGSYHAIFTQSASGPYTNFGGYSSTWPGGFTASIDIFLDTAMAAGQGFDYSVAASNSMGGHLRDFIFHVTKDTSTGDLLVGGSNNTNFNPREDLENLNHYEVSSSGWYTFEHVFRDDGGVLAVDLNLRDANGNLLFTETRKNGADLIASVVGGNRYGWFTNIDVTNGIAVDNAQLAIAPEPASLALWGLAGLAGAAALRRMRKRKA